MDKFVVIQVPPDAAQVTEAMGSKPKFWFNHPELCTCLFKSARPNTGEDWSEKIAAELCAALGLPHAKQELGIWQGQRGTVSPAMMIAPNEQLIHGNDVLAGIASSYPREGTYRVSQHTLNLVLQALDSSHVQIPTNWQAPSQIKTAVDTFVGYLLLDAWIGNGDRHHENWGLVRTSDRSLHLAPTYDHAASLGRELLDEKRLERLQNKSIGAYLNKNYSAFYAQVDDPKPLTTLAAFESAAVLYPQAASAWLMQLSAISSDWVRQILSKVPEDRMSSAAQEFAAQLLEINKSRLLAIQR